MIKNKDLKRRIVEISYKLKLGHIGSCLTAVDIIADIYITKARDEKFILSAGHAHLAHLVVQERMPMTPAWSAEWKDKTDQTSRLAERMIKDWGIHCDRRAGCDFSTGSLGHGIGASVGFALANRSENVYCLISDGELTEGNVWESFRIRDEQKLTNLKIYINWNGWGAYQQSNLKLGTMLKYYDIKPTVTGMDEFPKWLRGQVAHYKVLNKDEYAELMEILK